MGEATIALTGGGTGGHLKVVESVKKALLRRHVRLVYIGSQSGQDRQWFADDKVFARQLFLPTHGVVDRRGWERVIAAGKIVTAAWQAYRFLRQEGVRSLFSVGGFSAAPASFGAIFGRIPLFIHEQNGVEGSLNRVLAPFAQRRLSSYGSDSVPYPVDPRFFEKARERKKLKRVIFLGGSQGASAINAFALSLAHDLSKRGIGIIHQAGREYEEVAKRYQEIGVEVDLFAFDPNLHEKFAAADLAVSRAGASTLWELAANCLPTLFVPYPYAAGDHQYHNVKPLLEKGAGWVVRQKDLRPEIFWLAAKDEQIALKSRNLCGVIEPKGADMIADILISSLKRD